MRRTIVPSIAIVASVVCGWRSLVETLRIAWLNDDYTYILLILPMSVLLCAEQRVRWWQIAKTKLHFGRALLLSMAIASAIASGIRVPSAADDVQRAYSMTGVVFSWIMIFAASFGIPAAKANLLPLLLLLGMVPPPGAVLEAIIAILQRGSAWSAHVLFSLLGVPAIQHGIQITIPGLVINVLKECSSIRSSSFLLVSACALAQLFLISPWRRAGLIVLSIPLTVLKNAARIVTIAMLGTRVNQGYLHGRIHREGGIVFFAGALSILCIAIWILRRGDPIGHETDGPVPIGTRGAGCGRTGRTAARQSRAAVL